MGSKSLMILISLLLSCCSVLTASSKEILPDDIAAAFEAVKWDGYQAVFPEWYTVEDGYLNGDFYPVIMKNGDTNVLCVLSKHDGAWGIAFSNEHALYQCDTLPQNINYYVDPDASGSNAKHMQELTISYTFDPPMEQVVEVHYHFSYRNGAWNLRLIQVFAPPVKGGYVDGMDYRETKIYPAEGSLTYRTILNEKDQPYEKTVAYNGKITLEAFDVSTIPLSY